MTVATGRMQYRRIGRTDLHLSVVGIGSAQFRRLPAPQVLATMRRGFELGVNWVHTAPDYGGAEELIAEAIAGAGREIVPLSNGYGEMAHFRFLFERTCRIFGRERLPIWGISCIDDAEFVGWDVWGPNGQVAFLQELKRQGRIGAAFCTTHGPPDYVARLVECGAFDAVMLSYNPLGFHVLSYHAASEGKVYENLEANRQRIFPLAARHGVSLLVMKPFAGGLLLPGKAFPPKAEFAPVPPPTPAAVIAHILAQPGVAAVCPGTGSPEEAAENARAGHAIAPSPTAAEVALLTTTAEMRASLCSRCGACEPTCSRGLPISWLFREAYIWNRPSDTFESNTHQHYFHLHPDTALACATCDDRTCECPAGLDVPSRLGEAHAAMLARRAEGALPATPADLLPGPLPGPFPAHRLWSEVPATVRAGGVATCGFWLQNVGPRWWVATAANPDRRDGSVVVLAVFANGTLVHRERLRHDVEPGYRTHFAFDLPVPAVNGRFDVRFALLAEPATAGASATVVLERPVTVLPAVPAARTVPAVAPAPAAAPEVSTPPVYGARYVEHSLPAQATAGEVLAVRLVLDNTGTTTWRPQAPGERNTDVAAAVDGVVRATVKLPHDVPPGGRAVVHFALRLPLRTGACRVEVHLVEQKVTTFPERGVPPLGVDIELQPARDRNAALWETFATVDPWHYMPTQGVARSPDGTPLPVFVEHAEGCRIRDAAGRVYLDYTMGWGTTLLGYAHPHVTAAMRAALASGPTVSWPTVVEMEVAQMLRDDIPCAEMVLFGKNGTDACTVAARLSRLFTGRRKILYCGYHGFGDWWVEQRGFLHSGVPDRGERLLFPFRFLDWADFEQLLQQHRDDLACVMLEPAGPFGGNDRGFEPDVDPAFLRAVAAATRRAGALLVFDEIITGYRYPGHSVQKAHGVVPDLACFGKALASGMPLSAVVGRRDVFESTLPRCHYGPTFKGEALSLVAAKASIEVCRREPVAAHVWQYGERLRAGILARCRAHGLAADMTGPPFRMSLLLREPDRLARLRLRTLLQQELLRAGLATYNGVMLPSYAHDDAALAETFEKFEQGLAAVADAVRSGAVEQRLRIPPLIDL